MSRIGRAAWPTRLLFLLIAAAALWSASAGAAVVRVLEVDGIIGPASADFIERGLKAGAEAGAEAIVIKLDTPGGLDTSMRQIIKAILASPVPVITYVHPEGARAASAGTFILYASHIAAMTPATNLGAASPVAVGGLPGRPTPKPPSTGDGDAAKDKGEATDGEGNETKEKADESLLPSLGGDTLARKATNDAAAYIRSLAELRGRNADFAERAVREAESLSADTALREGVIDIVAKDVPTLLKDIDGREVSLPGGARALQTADAAIELHVPGWRYKLLAMVANPQLAVVLMMIGFYGLFVEFTSPGFGVPGVAGAICLLLAMYAFQMLPINWAGVGLISFGFILMAAEVFLPSFGVLGIGGIIAFVLGGVFLFDQDIPGGYALSLPFLFGTALAAAGLVFLAGTMLVRSRKRPVATGKEEMIGSTGEITLTDGGDSYARVHGEVWRVRSRDPLTPGTPVRVTAIDGLVLTVVPFDSDPGSYP